LTLDAPLDSSLLEVFSSFKKVNFCICKERKRLKGKIVDVKYV